MKLSNISQEVPRIHHSNPRKLLQILSVVLVSIFIAVGFAVPANAATGKAAEMFNMINQERTSRGLPALVSDPTLDYAASQWAQHLANTGQFYHSTHDWRASIISGAGWSASGENLAAGYDSAASAMSGLMNSAGHKANILHNMYYGVGVAYVSGGPYGHYWVQIFGVSAPRVPSGTTPVISGDASVGSTLTASTSGWTSGTTIGWSWLSDGRTIPGANSATYKPTLSDAGRVINVTVSGSKSGYYPSYKTSLGTSPISGRPTVERLAGADRYATAAAISKAGFEPGVEVVYIASGLQFPDALSAAPAASSDDAPLLLTDPSNLPSIVLVELQRLNPERIVVVGGSASVSDNVLNKLKTVAPTNRVSGVDRYATSRAIAADAFASSNVAYIATGVNFPDALTASAIAGDINAPVILVYGLSTTIDTPTKDLLNSLGVTDVRIVGGDATVTNGIKNSLTTAGFSVTRLSGADRFDTAVAINEHSFTNAPTIYIASGLNFPDALAGAALAGNKGAPLYLATGTCLPHSIDKSLTKLQPTKIILLGGDASLSNVGVATLQRC